MQLGGCAWGGPAWRRGITGRWGWALPWGCALEVSPEFPVIRYQKVDSNQDFQWKRTTSGLTGWIAFQTVGVRRSGCVVGSPRAHGADDDAGNSRGDDGRRTHADRRHTS